MSRVKFNLNYHILVRLTDLGKKLIIKKYGYGYFETIWESEKTSDGYYKVQTYEFMNMFGKHLFNGCEMPCEPTVYFLEEDLEKENDL